MAKGLPVLPLLAGAAALFILRKKSEPTVVSPPKADDSGGGKTTLPDLPGLPDLIEETKEKFTVAQRQAWVDSAQLKKTRSGAALTGADLPENIDLGVSTLWVSDGCDKGYISQNWEPYWLDTSEGIQMSAEEYWEAVGKGTVRPDDSGDDDMGVSIALDFTYKVLNQNSVESGVFFPKDCIKKFPRKENYTSVKEWDNAWTHFYLLAETRVIRDIFFFVHDKVRASMLEAWGDKNPDAYNAYKMYTIAKRLVTEHEDKNDNQLTDLVYLEFYSDDPNVPAKLDPTVGWHAPYIAMWKVAKEQVLDIRS